MRFILTTIFFLLTSSANAGMDFTRLTTQKTVSYVKDVQDFKSMTLQRLNAIKQNPMGNNAPKVLEVIQRDLQNLALDAGRTNDQDFVDYHTKLEQMMVGKINKIKELYAKGPSNEYFDVVQGAIRELKDFKVPVMQGGVDESTGAYFQAWSKPK